MVTLETVSVYGRENWMTHTGGEVTTSTHLPAKEVVSKLESEDIHEVEEEIVGSGLETLENLRELIPTVSDKVLQYLGDIARRVNYRRGLLPTSTNELLDEWRDLRYAIVDEWGERHKRSRNVGPMYQTDGSIESIVGITERFLPDYVFQAPVYKMGSTTVSDTIVGEVQGDTKESVSYRDGQGISRDMYNSLMWTIDGIDEFEEEQFLLGPIGEEDLLLFRWSDYNSEWTDARVLGDITTYPTKYLRD